MMMTLRAWHSYLSIFAAPTFLFFALTGALQLFGLHETHGDYHPPALVQKLGRLHKDQVFALENHHDRPATEAPSPPVDTSKAQGGHDEHKPLATLALKWFFLFAALMLACSTCLGLWIGLTHVRRRRTGWILLGAGAVVPLGLVLLS